MTAEEYVPLEEASEVVELRTEDGRKWSFETWWRIDDYAPDGTGKLVEFTIEGRAQLIEEGPEQ